MIKVYKLTENNCVVHCEHTETCLIKALMIHEMGNSKPTIVIIMSPVY